MTIYQIKEIRTTVRSTEQEYFNAHAVEMVDYLLAEVERLEKQCAQYKGEGNHMIESLFNMNAKLTATEQKLA